MKFPKKISVLKGLALAVLLGAIFTGTALAAGTRVIRYASVAKIKVVAEQPATFRLLGSYTCDKVQINASVRGKVITIHAYDARLKQPGRDCGNHTSFARNVTVGMLVPGVYTIVVNPDASGKGARVLKGFIAPLIPTPPTSR